MYGALKGLVKKILPESVMNEIEFPLRSLYYPFVAGTGNTCPCCRRAYRKFIPIDHHGFEDDLCPGCGSLSRTRLLWLYLEKNQIVEEPKQVLHFSPHKYLRKILVKRLGSTYLDTNFDSKRCRHQFDICALPLKDSSQDLVVAYHIFEHIPEDRLAMSECFRVLKSKSVMLCQVPWNEGQTLEDPSITDPNERLRLFGQEDHVRYYGKEDFVQRLSSAGFQVSEVVAREFCSEEELRQMSLKSEEVIFHCRKPYRAPCRTEAT
jgi:SAM-dependent methyltransferase